VQKEPADSAGQPQPRYMRQLTDEAVRLVDDLRSGKLENQANFILSECFREAASAFSMINQQLSHRRLQQGWSRDVTVDIADELRRRYVEFGEAPDSILDFMEANRR
jgi:hypothetical protein